MATILLMVVLLMGTFSGIEIGGQWRYKPQPKQMTFHDAILNRAENGYRDFLYGGAAKGGKAVSLDTIISCTDGRKTMAEIEIGDVVFSDNGKPVKVVWVSDVIENSDVYEITLDTGEKIKADGNHLWKTFDEKERSQLLRHSVEFREHRKATRVSRALVSPKRLSSQKNITASNKARAYTYLPTPRGRVRTTKELFETQTSSRGRANHTIQNTAPLDTPARELLVDPYLLGLWLGDGNSDSGSIGMLVSDFEEILSKSCIEIQGSYFPRDHKQPFVKHRIKGLTAALRELSLIGNKRIPMDYLRASYLQRVALLQGLMDTDGHCDKRGQCEIGLSKKDLADDVHELICSLGIKCSTRVKPLSPSNPKHNDSHRMKFVSDIPVFRLGRKLERQNLTPSIETKHRTIISVVKCATTPVKCLQVENDDGMYLVGRTFIPTHNSHSLRWEAHRNCLQYPRLRGLLLRSSFPELERTHLSLINFDLPHDVMHYNGQYHKATYFNGSTLEFGYGERKEDFKQYLSAEYDFIMIDELTTIPFEFSFLLRSRLAASRSDFIPFWACATNPGDVAHVDVRSYFVKKTMHDEERFPEYNPSAVCFIPATVFDNIILMGRDPGIVQRLRQLSKKDQQKFLYGNWDIFEGQFFDEFFSDIHVVKPADYLTYQQLSLFQNVAGMDYGNYSAAEFQYKDYNGNVVVYDEWSDIKSVRSVKIASLKKFMADRSLSGVTIEADTNMWVPDAFDKADRTDPASDFEAGGVMLQKVSKNVSRAETNRGYRVVCNDAVRNYLHWDSAENGEILVRPRLLIYERCHKLIETFPLLMVDENDQEDIADQGDLDTWYDAFKMGFMTLWQPIAPKKPKDAYKTHAEYVKEEIMEPIVRRTLAPRINSETI